EGVTAPTSSATRSPIMSLQKSDSVIFTAPAIADIGITERKVGARSTRTTCIDNSTFKTMGTASEGTALHNKTAPKTAVNHKSPVRTPRSLATSSPRAKAFKAGDEIKAMMMPMSRKGRNVEMELQFPEPTLPACQNLN